MVGNAFSPRYFRARQQKTAANPIDYSSLHVAVYGPGKGAFAFTERASHDVFRSREALAIGASTLRWETTPSGEDALVVRIHEVTSPFPSLVPKKLQGTVTLVPRHTVDEPIALDAKGRHMWYCHAPDARVSVRLDEPGLSFDGSGYLDENGGDEGLEAAFSTWQWCRASLPSGRAFVHYATQESRERGLGRRTSSRLFSNGTSTRAVPPRELDLGRTIFGLERHVRLDAGFSPTYVRTLEDGPHYARTLVRGRVLGEDAFMMHETFDGERFRAPWVRFLLPFRMRGGRAGLVP